MVTESRSAGLVVAVIGVWVLMAAPTSASGQSRDLEVRVDTLASGRVVVSNPDLAAVGRGKTLDLVEELRIGAALGTDIDDPELFGQVISLAVDEDENTYVADYQSGEIRVFDREGNFVQTIGRRGEGPGEFRVLAGVVWDRGSSVLWAVDAGGRRFNVFDRAGLGLATQPYGRDSYNAQIPWTGYSDLIGFMYYSEPRDFDMLLKARTSPDGELAIVDSLAVPQGLGEMDTYSAGLEIRVVPLQPETSHAVGPHGGVWLSTSSEFRLHKVDFSGDTVRTVELRRPARQLSRSERDSVAKANDLPTGRIPRQMPVIGRHLAGPNGWIWVPVEGDSTWEVFDDFGYHVGRVTSPVPLDSPPRIVPGAGTITGVTTDELGVQYVVRLRVRAPNRR